MPSLVFRPRPLDSRPVSGHGVTFLCGNDEKGIYRLLNTTQGRFSDSLLRRGEQTGPLAGHGHR